MHKPDNDICLQSPTLVQVDVFVGPVCDLAVAPVARQVVFWNIPIVSTGAMARDYQVSRSTSYQLLTRVGPTNFYSLTTVVSAHLHYFNWNRFKLVYYKEGLEKVMKGFCHLAIEALHYSLKEIDSLMHQDVYRVDDNKPDFDRLFRHEIGLEFAGSCLVT